MPDVCFAIPGDVTALTGGYAYARRLMRALPGAGWHAHHVELPSGFPNPSSDDLAATSDILGSLPADAVILIDGLAFGAMPADLVAGLDGTLVALVHHPLAEETGLNAATVARLRKSERDALALAQGVVVTSSYTGATLARDYGVPRDWITLALPGTDGAERARGSTPPKLLTVATLTHRKAPDVLVEALARIVDLGWTNDIVGSAERDPEVAAKVRALVAKHRLQERINLRGEMQNAALDAAYMSADIFVLPSRHEGYGMVFAEAMAHGLPIVACAAGAVPDTVPADAGILVPPDDPQALADALRKLLTDNALCRKLADQSWTHGQKLPSWDDTAACVADALWAALP